MVGYISVRFLVFVGLIICSFTSVDAMNRLRTDSDAEQPSAKKAKHEHFLSIDSNQWLRKDDLILMKCFAPENGMLVALPLRKNVAKRLSVVLNTKLERWDSADQVSCYVLDQEDGFSTRSVEIFVEYMERYFEEQESQTDEEAKANNEYFVLDRSRLHDFIDRLQLDLADFFELLQLARFLAAQEIFESLVQKLLLNQSLLQHVPLSQQRVKTLDVVFNDYFFHESIETLENALATVADDDELLALAGQPGGIYAFFLNNQSAIQHLFWIYLAKQALHQGQSITAYLQGIEPLSDEYLIKGVFYCFERIKEKSKIDADDFEEIEYLDSLTPAEALVHRIANSLYHMQDGVLDFTFMPQGFNQILPRLLELLPLFCTEAGRGHVSGLKFGSDQAHDDWAALGTLEKFKRLERLELFRVGTSARLGEVLPKLINLKHLKLSHCSLGVIPEGLVNLEKLEVLEIESCFFHNDATLPACLGKLNELKKLSIRNTSLQGPIPPELADLSKLEELILDTNNLVGQIPSELSNLISLKRLIMYHNALVGEIPESFQKLINLEELHLGLNALTGTLPQRLTQLSQLRVLHVAHNQLDLAAVPSWIAQVEARARQTDGYVMIGHQR